jgi:hypothetical protein
MSLISGVVLEPLLEEAKTFRDEAPDAFPVRDPLVCGRGLQSFQHIPLGAG